jgi:thioester reductase-like protein
MEFKETIFLTGFPGFIAERLVERLAAPERQQLLLVQPAFVDLSVEKLEAIAARTGVPLENFALIEGDIAHPDLGMPKEDADLVRELTTHVFHLAAVYDLVVSKDAALSVNVEGTQNVSSLVRTMPHLRRYSYISTCYVAGKREGLVLETELEHQAGFRNFYEESKYLAETAVEELKTELPVTIFRPSVVVGDSKTGEIPKYDGIYYLIHYLRKSPQLLRLINVGNAQVKLNLVPVDFVVDAIAALAFDEQAEGKTLAIADPNPPTTREIFDVLAENISGKRSVIVPPPSVVERSLMLSISPPITGLPHSGVPYFFLAQTYDTAVAERLLAKHGIACPSFRDYAGNLISFVDKHPEL